MILDAFEKGQTFLSKFSLKSHFLANNELARSYVFNQYVLVQGIMYITNGYGKQKQKQVHSKKESLQCLVICIQMVAGYR